MTYTRRRSGLLGAVVALAVAAIAPGAAHAAAMIINAGDTALFTRPGSIAVLNIPGDANPGDVLGLAGVPLSPPRIETELVPLQLTGTTPIIAPVGNLGSLTLFQKEATLIEPADTIVRRTSSLTLPNPGDAGTIPIELVELHLQSVSPLVLRGNTPVGNFLVDTLFDVFVDIDPLSTPVGGSAVTVTRTGETTASFSGNVGSQARARLHQQSTGADSFFDVFVNLQINGSFEVAPANAVPAPGGAAAVIAWGLWLALWRRRQLKG